MPQNYRQFAISGVKLDLRRYGKIGRFRKWSAGALISDPMRTICTALQAFFVAFRVDKKNMCA
jgi:hypothetical protein